MKKGLLFVSVLLTGLASAQCTDLIISEYVEGFSNNKALEIYNPTPNPINLSQYFVSRLSNGSNVAVASASVQLVGTIAPYSTHVGVLDKQNPAGTGLESPVWTELIAKADAFYSPVYATNTTWYWNGNDAIMLAKGSASNPNAVGTVLVDVFGKIGQNPENTVAGTLGWSSIAPYNYTSNDPLDRIVTEDHSMIRKRTVMIGKNSPAEVFGPSYVFDPLAQYDSIPPMVIMFDPINGDTLYQNDGITPRTTGNWNSLGSHVCDCSPDASVKEKNSINVTIYPNPSNGIFTISGSEDIASIEVLNSLGSLVKTINSNSKSHLAVDLNNNPGVYFLKLTTVKGESVTKRVIVK